MRSRKCGIVIQVVSDKSTSLLIGLLKQTANLFLLGGNLLQVNLVDHSKSFVELVIQPNSIQSVRLVFLRGEDIPPRFGIKVRIRTQIGAGQLLGLSKNRPSDLHLRTLSDFFTISGLDCDPLVKTDDGCVVWARRVIQSETFIFIGTRFLDDVITYRQGLSTNVQSESREKSLWGFPNERANYLYEGVAEPSRLYDRQADWWSWLLFESLQSSLAVTRCIELRKPVQYLVVTGDDDQADLDMYERQQRLLSGIPTTYFLHPLTKHSKRSLSILSRTNAEIELGLHPDALEQPTEYERLFSQQIDWFSRLVGSMPSSIRNHGFLNDGYWRHAQSWLKYGVKSSSNIAGLDGRIISNSLLPFPLVLDNEITNHQSIVTAFGDGMVFALRMTDNEASQRVIDFSNDMRRDVSDGALVINLHPQNVDSTPQLHMAIRQLVESGFVPTTLTSLVEKFEPSN